MTRRLPLVLAMLSAGAPGVAAADLLIVLNKSDHEAALVDPVSLKTMAKLPTGKGPHEVAVSPDGRLAYVSNYGMFGVFREGERRNEPGNTITVLDLVGRAVKDTFDLGEYSRPHGLAVSQDGRRLWVTCEGAQAVLELDAASGAILKAWKTTQETSHMLVAARDERKLYVANIRSGSVTIIDRAAGRVASLPTGPGSEGIDVTPDGREVWVSNRADSSLSVIDTARDTVVGKLASGGRMPIRVKFTP
ncbi:MAG: YncE family protein, partial [Candidatus Eisenbacteria bacterium]